jgi:Amt family ammonium transporter
MSAQWGGIGLNENQTMMSQVWVQLQAVGAIFLWTLVFTFIVLKIMSVTTGLRIEAEAERQGLDVATHNESGYLL